VTIPHQLRWTVWLCAVIVWTGLLLTPGNYLPPQPELPYLTAGKLLHMVAYSGLAASFGWVSSQPKIRNWAISGLIIHGGLTELIQLTIPNRDGSLRDWALDTVSVLIGWVVVRPWWPRNNR